MTRRPDVDRAALDALLARVFAARADLTVERTPTGSSTQVYRIDRHSRGRIQTFYLRVAETRSVSLAPEVGLHRALLAAGARVPDVVHYEPFDAGLDRSVMVTTEIAGAPVRPSVSSVALGVIGRAAGRDLARVHAVPVRGFGWIRREHGTPAWPLSAEHDDYASFVSAASVHAPLRAIGFGPAQAAQTVRLLEEATATGPTGARGGAAHGDFDVSHIFAAGDTYSGLIDFGELRGTDYPFDFATLELNAEPGLHGIRAHVRAGYAELHPLPADFDRRLFVACVLSAAHRLATWYRRDGDAAADGWFFRWIRDRLGQLLDAGRLVDPPDA